MLKYLMSLTFIVSTFSIAAEGNEDSLTVSAFLSSESSEKEGFCVLSDRTYWKIVSAEEDERPLEKWQLGDEVEIGTSSESQPVEESAATDKNCDRVLCNKRTEQIVFGRLKGPAAFMKDIREDMKKAMKASLEKKCLAKGERKGQQRAYEDAYRDSYTKGYEEGFKKGKSKKF